MTKKTLFWIGLIMVAVEPSAPPAGTAEEQLPGYLREQGESIPTSMFGTHTRRGQSILDSHYEYAEHNEDVVKGNEDAITSANKSYGEIRGVVLDQKTRKPLVGANIVVDGTRRGAVTNQNGAFTISRIPTGKYTLTFSYIGYARKKIDNIVIMPNETVDTQVIEMEEQPIHLRQIVVTPGSYAIMGSEPSVRQTLTSEDIKIMGWAEDITRAVQRIPGISSNDFSAKFSIRGGDTDEVLVLLDDMQI